jgi:hypothetical protein
MSAQTAKMLVDTAGMIIPQMYDSVADLYRVVEVNKNITVLASAARTTTTNSADQKNTDYRGVHVVVDITAVPGVETVTPKIQGKDALSGKYYDILVGAAQVATGTVILKVAPGLLAAANTVANDALPIDWRIVMTHSAAGSFTYSVGANLVR